jgi:hypothetical protein
MRKTIPATPRHMKQRIVTKFLLTPMTLRLPDSLLMQKRWLETTSWIEEWGADYGYDEEDPYSEGWWRKIGWLDDD